jgi:two-component system, NarL family, sensor kinase
MSRRGTSRVRVVRLGVRRELGVLVGFGIVVMLLVGVGAAFVSRSVAQGQALEDSERITVRMADLVMKPLLPGYLAGDKGLDGELHRLVRNRMSDGNITEVTVWSAAGQVLYSNKVEDIGDFVKPPPTQLDEALAGQTLSGFESDAPEADTGTGNNTPADAGPNRFVEVYTPLDVPGRPRMVFEAYYDYAPVNRIADQLLKETLPLVLIPLLILQLIQIPVAVSLARRLKRHENERARLLERALSVSDRERVRFAADLHDGPIQDLAGISYALGAVAPTVAERHAPLMARVQDALQRSIQSLRGLMTDLYPPDLRSGNLDQTIVTLSDQLRAEGLEVELELEELPTMSDETVATLYRVVREALANVQKHAEASTVTISRGPVQTAPGGVEPRVRLVIADDGVGVDPSRLDRRAEGHLGLRLLADRVESLGGQLVITTAVGHGTSVEADLPVRSAGNA